MNIDKLERLAAHNLLVGYPANSKTKDGQSIAKYAKANNYGVYTGKVRIPARGFMEYALTAKKYTQPRERLIESVIKNVNKTGLSPEVGLNRVGVQVVNHIRDSIRTGPWVANAPSVQAAKLKKSNGKGTPKPLIDTGAMLRATTFLLVPRKGGAK